MVLDVECFRKQDDPKAVGPDQVREMQKKRFKDVAVVDRIIAADEAWRKCRYTDDNHRRVLNACSKAIGQKMKNKEPQDGDTTLPPGCEDGTNLEALSIAQLKALVEKIKKEQQENEVEEARLLALRSEEIKTVGNLLHDSVPVSDNEDNNGIERIVGDAGEAFSKKYSHVDLIEMIGGVELVRGANTSGNRCYYLRGPAVALENALTAFAQSLLVERDYVQISPPLFMRKEVMQEVAQLSQFDEELYKVTGKASEKETDTEIEEKYLIATAEQPIAALHRGEWLDPAQLPIKYCGLSECFRQEVGSHGRDTRGIFRVHQFKKVEQFVITSPHDNESWKMMDHMMANSEDFCKLLGLPYRVVNIVSGALNLAASKKLDLEAWFPGSKAFRELVSCSNCTDYQSRRLQIRFGLSKKLDSKAEYVHMLNSTLCATTRVICCILENFQVGDLESQGGVVVPEVLRPFMPSKYREFIPFVNPAPIEEEEKKKKEDEAKAAKKKGKGKK
eukprot:m.321200 g.321200  ORF g.321200 m.321200 type:complete len:504 (+) comp25113_c0_seq1:160-1671(+)